jgi:hypothetical protein
MPKWKQPATLLKRLTFGPAETMTTPQHAVRFGPDLNARSHNCGTNRLRIAEPRDIRVFLAPYL